MLFVLTGPESCAKSSLATALSEHFQGLYVEEVARRYLQGRLNYQPSDLLQIAVLQQAEESAVVGDEVGHTMDGARESALAAPTLVFADTDLQVIYIWWQEKYGAVPRCLTRAYANASPRHYLLCAPDIPWQADELRENPQDRERLFALYKADLEARGSAFTQIQGQGAERLSNAIEAVHQAMVR